MLTPRDALNHLGYDEVDDVITEKVTAELAEAGSYLRGAVGEDIFELLPDDHRVDILLKAYLDDLHDDRGTTSAKANNAKRELVNSTEWQLRMTLSRKREEAASV
jgi:hypothetical protein